MANWGDSSGRDEILDAFEDKAKKIMLEAGIAALKDAGYKVTKSRDGGLNLRKNHGRGQNWQHNLDIMSYAVHVDRF